MAGLNLNLEISQPRGYAAKNGGVTFPRQAAKRAKANRERNGSVGQRWKLWTRKAGRMFEGAGTFNP